MVTDGSHDQREINVDSEKLSMLSLQDTDDLSVASFAHHDQEVDLSHEILVKMLLSFTLL